TCCRSLNKHLNSWTGHQCSRERPSCNKCKASGKMCIYMPKPSRTPLTRVHLTEVETRLSQYEAVFQALFPAGDVDQMISSIMQWEPREIPVAASSLSDAFHIRPPQAGSGLEPWQMNDPMSSDCSGSSYPDMGVVSSLEAVPSAPSALSFSPGASVVPAEDPSSLASQVYLVDSYFTSYHPNHPFVHEPSFRDFLQFYPSTPHPDGKAFEILYKAILAIGSWCLCDRNCEVDLMFFAQAREALSGMSFLEAGNVTLLQALLLLSDFAQKREMPETGLHLLGIAVRMAISLGLHNEKLSQAGLSKRPTLLDFEMRRRVWWSLYIFDSCATKSFGRPLLLPDDSFMDVKPVLNINDEDLQSTDTSYPPAREGPTIYSSLIAQTNFHRMANQIYRYLTSMGPISVERAAQFEKQIDDWRSSCPSYLQAAVTATEPDWLKLAKDRIVICDRNLRLLILRPFLMRWATVLQTQNMRACDETSINAEKIWAMRCLQIAAESMNLTLERIERPQFSRLGGSFLMYCLFQGILVHAVFLKSGLPLPEPTPFYTYLERAKLLLTVSWCNQDTQSERFLKAIRTLCQSFEPAAF
ncbi:Regulatory protein GAL4, partial [Penicillium rolfsii]